LIFSQDITFSSFCEEQIRPIIVPHNYGWQYWTVEGHNWPLEWRKTTAVCDIAAPHCTNSQPYRLQTHQILSVGFSSDHRLCGAEPRAETCKISHTY